MKSLFLVKIFTLMIFAIASFGAILIMGGADSRAGLLKRGAQIMNEKPEGYPSAVLAGGCFWCTESEYRALDGVLHTRVGYMGGETDAPTYRDITTGKTGHAEVVEVTFDPEIISFESLLEFFLRDAHDPTQLNRQGVDKGTQYRSAIFPVDADQEDIARSVIERLQPEFDGKIVTTIEPLATFWDGEDYHQQYYEKYREENGKDHIRVILKKAGQL